MSSRQRESHFLEAVEPPWPKVWRYFKKSYNAPAICQVMEDIPFPLKSIDRKVPAVFFLEKKEIKKGKEN